MTGQSQHPDHHPDHHRAAETLGGPGNESARFEIVSRSPGATAWSPVATLGREGYFITPEEAVEWWHTHAPANIVAEASQARVMRVTRTVEVASIEPAFGWDRFHNQERLLADEKRLAAARTLWVNSKPRDLHNHPAKPWATLADPAHRDQAAAAYRAAIAATMHRGIPDVRHSIHAAAETLGLTGDDL